MALHPSNAAGQQYAQIWETVSAHIRNQILAGELAAGERLVETDVADRFGVSRGPVREALAELAREGLVVDIPRRGMFVSTMTQADLREVYLVREALESVAAREAVQHATDAELAEVDSARRQSDAAWRGNDWPLAIRVDMDFHRTIIRLAKNARLADMYERMATQTLVLLVQGAEGDDSLRKPPLRALHKGIGDAVVRRDADEALLAIARHYRYTEHRLYTSLSNRHGALPGPTPR